MTETTWRRIWYSQRHGICEQILWKVSFFNAKNKILKIRSEVADDISMIFNKLNFEHWNGLMRVKLKRAANAANITGIHTSRWETHGTLERIPILRVPGIVFDEFMFNPCQQFCRKIPWNRGTLHWKWMKLVYVRTIKSKSSLNYRKFSMQCLVEHIHIAVHTFEPYITPIGLVHGGE